VNLKETSPITPLYLQSSGMVTNILIGVADGIMLPFALAAVLSMILDDSWAVLLICGAESIILAALFGFAAYQAVVNQAEEYPDPSLSEEKKRGLVAHLQLQDILRGLDLGGDILQKAADEGVRYQQHWNSLLTRYELGSPRPDFARARRSALYVGIAFLAGAVLPLIPYFWVATPATAFRYATIIALMALILFGYLKARYTGRSPWIGALRLLITGTVVVGAAWMTAQFFSP
jgi:hypothetical protein